MKARIMHTKIWTDSYFLELLPPEKLLFIYYLINPRITIIHLYECPDKIVALETGLDLKIIQAAKEKFQSAGKIYFFKNYIYIKNAIRYQKYKGQKNIIAAEKLLKEISKDILDWFRKETNTPIDTSLILSIKQESENATTKQKHYGQRIDESIDPDDIPL